MFAGFDTSNYTTSFALYDGKKVLQKKIPLKVKAGEKGLRQSEALFQHTVNLPEIMSEVKVENIEAVGVSTRPRNVLGSYMPCFLAGESAATAFASAAGTKLYKTSHQVGHILAALYGAGRLDLVGEEHIACHLSGGTTEILLVKPHEEDIIKADIIAKSLDLKAGQAIDRTGVALGLDFPCGKELDRLSQKSDREFLARPTIIGLDCSMSGVENKMKDMLKKGESKEDIAKFVLTYVSRTILRMLEGVFKEYGKLPVIFSGGVSSNSLLREIINKRFPKNIYFAPAEYSLDNAAGCAIFAQMKHQREV